GRKGTQYVTKVRGVAWTPWSRSRSAEEQRRQVAARALAEAGKKAPRPQVSTGNELNIPVMEEEAILV
ncbi:unnamed protein product, partial [marine sediment metagenome]